MAQTPWHSFELLDVFKETVSHKNGISLAEAKTRLNRNGSNELPAEKSQTPLELLLGQIKSPLMYLMMFATVVSFIANNILEAVFILVVMISNVIVGFYQEYKADKSLSALKNVVKARARVVRGGREYEINASEIVVGDIIALRPGDQVPADGRIVQLKDLQVNEASLTGESKAVTKNLSVLPEETPVADRVNMLFMGTFIEEGSATMLVVGTGSQTQYGDIVALLRKTAEEPTPLQKSVAGLSKFIGVFITFVVVVVVIIGISVGYDFDTIFESSLALFVSAIPEGLLPAITIVLVLGVRQILKRQGLVRRLAATETLGGVTVICTDKTGTLTEGNMSVSIITTGDGEYAFTSAESHKDVPDFIKNVMIAATLTADAYAENPSAKEEDLIVRGSMTEQALIKRAITLGIDTYKIREERPILDTIIFSSDRKYSAMLRSANETENTLYILGAPERILDYITHTQTEKGLQGKSTNTFKKLIKEQHNLVAKGYRVVLSASRQVPKNAQYEKLEDLLGDMTILGFIAISDPLRADVPEAFRITQKAGIRTIIVTGDNLITARLIAEQLGFKITEKNTLEGGDIEKLSDAQLKKKMKSVALCARVSPRHKLRIVEALQSQGEVVAMFGDGANDAPALKTADIGVAVQTKVSAVREVADLVLLDGGFGTITKAIEQGRIIFNNIRRIFLYLITQDFSQFFVFITSILLGLPLPILAVQLLFINLIESGLPDLALTTEQESDGIMDEPPRDPKESILNKQTRRWMIASFIISGGMAMMFYLWVFDTTGNLLLTRTMVMVFLCLESLFLSFSMRSFTKSIFRKTIFSNKFIVWAAIISFGMILLAVYLPLLQNILQTVPLMPFDWLMIIIVNLAEILLIDQSKRYFFSHKN